MTVSKQRAIAATFAIAGIIMGVLGIVFDLNGGPSALHVLTWVGGGLFGFGVVNLVTVGRRKLN